jgi:hypothetical protein
MNASELPPAAPSTEPEAPGHRLNWLIFFLVLLAPAALAFIGSITKVEGLAVAAPLVGGGIAGLICGIQLALRFGKTTGARVLLGCLFFALLGSLSLALGFAGCMVGGFKMDFR